MAKSVGIFTYRTQAGPRWGVKLKLKGLDGVWRRRTWRGFTSKYDAQRFMDIYSHLYGNERAVDRLEQSGKVARI